MQDSAVKKAEDIAEQANTQVSTLCENLQKVDENVEVMQKVIDRTNSKASALDAMVWICGVELKKVAALT